MSTLLAVLWVVLLVMMAGSLLFVGLVVLGRTLAGIRKIRRDRAWLRARADAKRRAETRAGVARYSDEMAKRQGVLRYSPGVTVGPGEAVVIPLAYVTWPDE